MTSVARGLAAILLLSLSLGACTQQQMRAARDNTLGFFGIARKPEVARVAEPPKPPPVATTPVPEAEPVPSAAPRAPVETNRVAPPPGVRASSRRS